MIIKLAVAAAILFVAEIIREHYSFRIVRYQVPSDRLKGMKGKCRIAFLSDLHNQEYGKGNGKLLEAIEKERPDYIFIGGDMLVARKGSSYRAAADFVTKLPRICPVYYANGNHEQRMKEQTELYGNGYLDYRRELAEAGVIFLENATREIRIGDLPACVTGLEIPLEKHKKCREGGLRAEEINAWAGDSSSFFQILLAHNPVYMRAYYDWGAQLVLAGHLHGGIVRLPGIGGLISTGFKPFPKYAGGIYRNGRQTAIVGKGLGTHTIPVRLFNPAELVVLDLSEPCEIE